MTVAGVTLTHPERVLYPEAGLTKQDLAAYYEMIAPRMLRHAAGRPLSLLRCPEGRAESCFFQKHWGRQLPKGVRTVAIREANGAKKPYAVVDDAAGLVSLVQYGVLEFHLWGARADRVDAPDRIVFDLDPAPGVPWSRVTDGAKALRVLLQEAGLASWLKTTGGKGLHVVVPVARGPTWKEVAGFARAVAFRLVHDGPEKYLATASKTARKGKVFVDWLRNTRGATAVAPWSTRAREGAPISVPLAWTDLARLRSGDQFSVTNVARLVAKNRTDPWEELPESRQRLSKKVLAGPTGGN